MNDHFECGTHDLKCNISRYLQWLEEGTYKAIIVKRGKRKVGILMSLDRLARQREQRAAQNMPDLVRNSD